jgi:hypothetical protein
MLPSVTSHQAQMAPLPLLLAPQWWALPSPTTLLLLLLAQMPQPGLYCCLQLQQPCLLLLLPSLELPALARHQHQRHHLLLLLLLRQMLPQGNQQ